VSDVDGTSQAELSAVDIEATAADWFGRRQFWDWSEQKQVELDVWLNQSLAHRVAYWRLEGAWSRTERLNAVHLPMRTSKASKTQSHQKSSRWFAAIAAVVVIAIVGGVSLLGEKSRNDTYATSVGERKTLTLADGSQIELNTNTVLQIGLGKNQRSVRLEKGEAFFQIKHDPLRPFKVAVAGRLVTDLGTKFSVREKDERVLVSLVEGRALFQTAETNGRAMVLLPGYVAVATKDEIVLTKHRQSDLANQLSWRNGTLAFDNTTLGQAAEEFNRYNRTQLIISDPAVAKIPVGGKFPVNGVDRFADVVTHVFGLHLKTRAESMTITR
jgi:transmembrane sensor